MSKKDKLITGSIIGLGVVGGIIAGIKILNTANVRAIRQLQKQQKEMNARLNLIYEKNLAADILLYKLGYTLNKYAIRSKETKIDTPDEHFPVVITLLVPKGPKKTTMTKKMHANDHINVNIQHISINIQKAKVIRIEDLSEKEYKYAATPYGDEIYEVDNEIISKNTDKGIDVYQTKKNAIEKEEATYKTIDKAILLSKFGSIKE